MEAVVSLDSRHRAADTYGSILRRGAVNTVEIARLARLAGVVAALALSVVPAHAGPPVATLTLMNAATRIAFGAGAVRARRGRGMSPIPFGARLDR